MSGQLRPKLSVEAQMDDLVRMNNALLQQQDYLEDKMGLLLLNFEECRVRWRDSLLEAKRETADLVKENKALSTRLKNVRHQLLKQNQNELMITNERQSMSDKLSMIRKMVSEKGLDHETKRVIFCLDQLQPINEVPDSSDQSLSDLDYDHTDEDIEETSNAMRKAIAAHPFEDGSPSIASDSIYSSAVSEIGQQEQEHFDTQSNHRDSTIINITLSDANPVEPENYPTQLEVIPKTVAQIVDNIVSHKVNGLGDEANVLRTMSTPVLPKRLTSRLSLVSRLEFPYIQVTDRLENKSHDFVTKKSFMPSGEKCRPCGSSVRFCGQFLRCKECLATAHPECKEKVSLPCIPRVTVQGLKRTFYRPKRLDDFVGEKADPPIPALVVYCVIEIEKRGFGETGLYRVKGNAASIKQLMKDMIASKSGMPVISGVSVHDLAQVVKLFLQSLEDPLICRILWRDFVRVWMKRAPEDRKVIVYQGVSELLPANRATLAYLMTHFNKIVHLPACQVTAPQLAQLMGPAIVGNSVPNLPSVEQQAEHKKQVAVMEALFEMPVDYWGSLLQTQTPVKPITGTNRRSSIGVVGGTLDLDDGTMNPQTPKTGACGQQTRLLKALF